MSDEKSSQESPVVTPKTEANGANGAASDAKSPTAVSDGQVDSLTNSLGNKVTLNEEDEPEPSADKVSADASLLQKILRSKLEEVSSNIEIERKNPDSPLYSVKKFEELNLKPELLKGLYAMGFTRPSKIQETALPALLNDPPQNLIAQSQSGTGKTAAFVLTMLSHIDTNQNYPQALCLAPTMELACQIADVAHSMGQFIPGLKIALGIKGQQVRRGIELNDHLIIGTPGTVFDWSGPRLNVLNLKKIKAFCLDEADVMIDQQGHQDFCIRIVKGLPNTCQMMLFSATYKNQVMEFANKIVKEPMIIRLRRQDESLSCIKQVYVKCESFDLKYKALSNIYGLITVGQSMIFCRTQRTARELVTKLNADGISCELLSGELEIDQRASVIQRFRDGKSKMLVTTNVSARGIDIDDVKLVVNFDLPTTREGAPDFETYLHRIGRTGRFGKSGIAINLVDSANMPIMERIEKHFDRKIEKLDAFDPDQIEKISQ